MVSQDSHCTSRSGRTTVRSGVSSNNASCIEGQVSLQIVTSTEYSSFLRLMSLTSDQLRTSRISSRNITNNVRGSLRTFVSRLRDSRNCQKKRIRFCQHYRPSAKHDLNQLWKSLSSHLKNFFYCITIFPSVLNTTPRYLTSIIRNVHCL